MISSASVLGKVTLMMSQTTCEPDSLRERLKHDPEGVLAEEFTRERVRLWRMVQFRLDPVVAARGDADGVLQDGWIAAVKRVDYFLEHESLSMFVWLRLIVGQ